MKKITLIAFLIITSKWVFAQCEYVFPKQDTSQYVFVECLAACPVKAKGKIINNQGSQCVKFKDKQSGAFVYEFFIKKPFRRVAFVVLDSNGKEIWRETN